MIQDSPYPVVYELVADDIQSNSHSIEALLITVGNNIVQDVDILMGFSMVVIGGGRVGRSSFFEAIL